MDKKALGKTYIILSVFIAIIIIGSIIWFFQSQTSSNEPNANQELIEKIQKYQQGDKSGEWQTYNNDIYGFEVQYPPYGFITADTYRFAQDIDDYMVEFHIPRESSSLNSHAFFIEIMGGKNDLDEFSSLPIGIAMKSGGNVSDIIVGGVPAKKTIRFSNDGAETRIILFIKESRGYYITLFGPEFDDAEKMLTTFKFNK